MIMVPVADGYLPSLLSKLQEWMLEKGLRGLQGEK
jgi:hypothetical protein